MKTIRWARSFLDSVRRSLSVRRSTRLGLALGPDRIVVIGLRRSLFGVRPGRVQARALAPPAEDGTWPDLTAALKELTAELGVRRATASLALLRPLANAKVITVPPVRRRDLRQLVVRNLRRYFIVGREPVEVDAAPLERGRRGEPVQAIAVCAETRRLEAIQAALSDAGLGIETITAAPLALARAVSSFVPAARRGPLVISLRSPEWSEGIAVQRGIPRLLQPWNGANLTEVPLFAKRLGGIAFSKTGSAAPVGMIALGPPEERQSISEALGRETGVAPLADPSLEALEPAAVAAYGATLMPEGATVLFTAGPRRARRLRIHLRVAALSAAALLMLGVAAALYLSGLRREFDAVAAERRAIAAEVADAMELRQTAEAIRVRLEAVSRIEKNTLAWTPALAALADALPDSAYLLSLSADGVQLRLAGVASSASAVVPALEASPLLREVSLTAARQSDRTGEAESFDLALALEPDTSVTAPDSAARGGVQPGGGG